MDEDKRVDARHVVEEAMSKWLAVNGMTPCDIRFVANALLRSCQKCAMVTPFDNSFL